jgi:hypothetical protein
MLTSTEDLWTEFNVDLTGTHGSDSLTADMNKAATLLQRGEGKAFTKDE